MGREKGLTIMTQGVSKESYLSNTDLVGEEESLHTLSHFVLFRLVVMGRIRVVPAPQKATTCEGGRVKEAKDGVTPYQGACMKAISQGVTLRSTLARSCSNHWYCSLEALVAIYEFSIRIWADPAL